MPAPNLCQVSSISSVNSHSRFCSSPFSSFLLFGRPETDRSVALNQSMSTLQALPIRIVAKHAHALPRKVQTPAPQRAAPLMGARNQETLCFMDFVHLITQSVHLNLVLELYQLISSRLAVNSGLVPGCARCHTLPQCNGPTCSDCAKMPPDELRMWNIKRSGTVWRECESDVLPIESILIVLISRTRVEKQMEDRNSSNDRQVIRDIIPI